MRQWKQHPQVGHSSYVYVVVIDQFYDASEQQQSACTVPLEIAPDTQVSAGLRRATRTSAA